MNHGTTPKAKNKFDFLDILSKSYDYIFPTFFYIAGLILGSMLYKNLNLDNLMKLLIANEGKNIESIFLSKISIYLILYTITILIGLCIVGFPVIQIIPLLTGFCISIKIAYYYNLYSIKGVGFSALAIIPQISAFMIALILTTIKAKSLSKNVYDLAHNKSINEINTTSYLKSFTLYFVAIIIICIVNSLMLYILNSIITL